jgi:hypothetical protein
VSKKFGEWYQKTNKTEDTNKLNLLTFKIIAIIHNTLLATFLKLLETVSKGLKSIMKGARFADLAAIQGVTAVLRSIRKEAFADSFQKLY